MAQQNAVLEARLSNEIDTFRRMYKPSNREVVYYDVVPRNWGVQVNLRVGEESDGRSCTYGLDCGEFGYQSAEKLSADVSSHLDGMGLRKPWFNMPSIRSVLQRWNPFGVDY